jgi:nitroimidazol reductase NimA-like FMN-containing flavoprotein (pyridoxamine 5'-phosphate oxidase superfamily)
MATTMTVAERESFLADVHVGVLSIADDPGPPLSAPIWYSYEPGGEIRFLTGGDSVKGRALRAAGAASLCVQSEEPPLYKYVVASGPVRIEDGADPEERRAIAYRYFGEGIGDLYLAGASSEGSITVVLTPEVWRTTDFGKAF